MSIVSTIDLNLSYGKHHVLHDVTMDIEKNEITALIGPSGCGKSTFLKTLNRMNDLVPGCKISGEVLFDGTDIYSRKVDAAALRKKVGMVFQKANPFRQAFMIILLMRQNTTECTDAKNWMKL